MSHAGWAIYSAIMIAILCSAFSFVEIRNGIDIFMIIIGIFGFTCWMTIFIDQIKPLQKEAMELD